MKAKERKLKKEKEKNFKENNIDDENKSSKIKKKLISIPINSDSQNNQEILNASNVIEDIGASVPADNKNVERIRNRIKKRKNKNSESSKQLKQEPNFSNKDLVLNNNSNNNQNNNIENFDSAVLCSENNYYKFLNKDYNNITKEEINDFLKNTNIDLENETNKKMLKMMQIMNIKSNNILESNLNTVDSLNQAYKKLEKYKINYEEQQKEIKDLRQAVIDQENQIETITKTNKIDLQNYMDKIIILKNKLINSPIYDIISLEESNKLDDIKINDLKEQLIHLRHNNEVEKAKIKSLVKKDLIPLENELNVEIQNVRYLKDKLIEFNNRELPQDLKNKLQVIMNYKTEL